jgi:cytochrome c oxidase subunit 3
MPRTLTRSDTGGAPPLDTDLPHYGGDDGKDRPEPGNQRKTSMTGIVVLMCASIMTFGAFLSAMVIRRGLGVDWGSTPLPHLLYWNTAMLLLSSVVLDIGRRKLHGGNRRQFNSIWTVGVLLGMGFIVGQFVAWQQLSARGIFINSNPSSSFFYAVTWAHAAHAVGAMFALMYIEYRALRFQLGPGRRTMVDVTSVFWHFLDVLWIGIMVLFRYWA